MPAAQTPPKNCSEIALHLFPYRFPYQGLSCPVGRYYARETLRKTRF